MNKWIDNYFKFHEDDHDPRFEDIEHKPLILIKKLNQQTLGWEIICFAKNLDEAHRVMADLQKTDEGKQNIYKLEEHERS